MTRHSFELQSLSRYVVVLFSLGRFTIWAGNIGALQPFESKSSLDYRLRDAQKIAIQIAGLLDDLAELLEDGVYRL